VNSGLAGETQIGKILTVYCVNDDELVALSSLLANAWSDPRAPEVVSDLRSSQGQVYFRYGAFDPSATADASGRPVYTIRDDDGRSVRDVRRIDGAQPAWAPRLPARVEPAGSGDRGLLASELTIGQKQYFLLTDLHSRAGTRTQLAVDLGEVEARVVKRGRRGALSDLDGIDIVDRLRNEFEILKALSREGLTTAPTPYAFDYDGEVATLVESFIPGERASDLDPARQAELLPELAAALERLHSLGFVHGDVKLENVILGPAGLALVDFELSARIGTPIVIHGGTPGYVPSELEGQTTAGRVAGPAVDAYALGATVFRAATGLNPGSLPPPNRKGRMLGLLSLRAPEALQTVRELTSGEWTSENQGKGPLLNDFGAGWPRGHYRRMLPRRSKALLRITVSAADGSGPSVTTRSEVARRGSPRDPDREPLAASLAYGSPGVILALRTVDFCTGMRRYDERIRQETAALSDRPCHPDAQGMFTGNAGVALALGAAARRYQEPIFLAAARRRLSAARNVGAGNHDLFSGSAGIIWSACALSRILEVEWPLEMVADHARQLRRVASVQEGVVCWSSAPEYDHAQSPYFGAAHGSAGNALALALWGASAGCSDSTALALETLTSLCRNALLGDRFSLRVGPGRSAAAPAAWCHGTFGLLWALTQVSYRSDEALSLVAVLLESMPAHLQVPSNPSLCHGLAGVVDIARAVSVTGVRSDLLEDIERASTDMLRLYALRAHGYVSWPKEDGSKAEPNLLAGYLGPAAALSMVAAHQRRMLISQEWLRACFAPDPAVIGGGTTCTGSRCAGFD
jgi:hypothetical protein